MEKDAGLRTNDRQLAGARIQSPEGQHYLGAMAAAGLRGPIVAVAVVGDGEDALTPCGACRQVIFEFGADAVVYGSGDGGRPVRSTIRELLPHAFGPMRLNQAGT